VTTEIFCFSGTGNSLTVARDVAERTGGSLTSIPSLMDCESVKVDADAAMIVFPVSRLTVSTDGARSALQIMQ